MDPSARALPAPTRAGAARRCRTASTAPPAAPPAATWSRISLALDARPGRAAELRRRGLRRGARRGRGRAAELAEGAPVLEAARDRRRRDRRGARRALARRGATPPSSPPTRSHRALAAAAASGELDARAPRRRAASASWSRSAAASTRAVAALLRARARGGGGRGDAEAVGRPAHRRRTQLLLAARRCSARAALAHALGIPHLTLDLEDAFRARGRRRVRRRLPRRGGRRTRA